MEHNGFSIGVVVQNNDPEKRGRVKVFVPHVSATLYSRWNELNIDKNFSKLGFNEFSSLSAGIMDDLKDILPWAEFASPLIGSNGSGRYNAFDNYTTQSDSSFRKSTINTPVDSITLSNDPISSFILSTYSSEYEGQVPISEIEYEEFKLSDAFEERNPLASNYKPKRSTNRRKGVFSIPDVGTHVWVFFHNGDPMYPVYFATVMGQEDWEGVYDDLDYPSDYENWSSRDKNIYDHKNNVYRNSLILNEKGGSIEICNTDHREKMTLTHFSGSYKEFNNYSTIELSTKNDQKLVLKDGFYTWRGDRYLNIDGDQSLKIHGDIITVIGKPNRAIVQQWKDEFKEIHDTKQLFEIKRTNSIDNYVGITPTSELQTQDGEFADCPVCNGKGKKSYWVVDYQYNSYDIHEVKQNVDEVTDYENVLPIDEEGSDGKLESGDSGKIFQYTCPTCNGSGLSPSSKDGSWKPETKKDQLKDLINNKLVSLAKIEERLGIGGSEIKNIAKHKIETIGYTLNDFTSIRMDEVGKIDVSKVTVNTGGVFDEEEEGTLIEYVYVDDFPTGNYNLTVGNKYAVIVGAGGYKMKSYGPVDISGTVMNISGEQLNIGSSNQIIVDGGKRLDLIADVVNIKQRNNQQVVVDSSLGITRNMIIGGGLHVEGELSLTHVTAPKEIQQTLETIVYSYLLDGLTFKCNIKDGSSTIYAGSSNGADRTTVDLNGVTITLTADSNHDKVKSYPHSHHFPNLPLHLKDTVDGVRERATGNNENSRNKAELVSNELKI